MRRRQGTTLLRFMAAALVALVALSGFGPRPSYAHSHPVSGHAHHAHADHDDGDRDDHHDEVPSLNEGVAHVHGSWFGFAITLPAIDGAAAPESGGTLSACPVPSGEPGKGLFGPLKERVPWPEFSDPPDPPCLRLLAARHAESPSLGDRASHALAGSTLLLRC